MRLQDKVAVVTGGNGGMGRAITAAFAREGCAVAAFDVHDPPAAQAVRRDVHARGGRAAWHEVDVTDRAAVEAAIATVAREIGPVDVLVNAAAVFVPVPFLDLTDTDWDRTLAINLKSYFLCGQVAARAMAARGSGGKIVNISSNSQTMASPNTTPYSAAKGGVAMLTRNMALELAPYRINVNAICPGPTLTDMNRERFADPEFYAARVRTIPWGRLGEPEDIAEAVLFLASPASDFMTGAALLVDGGQTLTVWQ
jgi:NAD(P)-dependent dehydrogenase (short-subunit alcohol dehydrogenase family)